MNKGKTYAERYNVSTNENGVLDSLMLCCIAFEEYCRYKYVSKINGKYFKNEFEIDYGDGDKMEDVYKEFIKQYEA